MSSNYLEVLGFAEAAHSALNVAIYRFSNDVPHFKAEIVDPKKFWPNVLFCLDIENSITA